MINFAIKVCLLAFAAFLDETIVNKDFAKWVRQHWSIESAPQAHEGVHNELKLCA
jgi:hypothetical protein